MNSAVHFTVVFQTKFPNGQKLMELTSGSRVGVSLDTDRNLLVHVDGVCLGVASRAVPQPAFALFDMWDYSYKVCMTVLCPGW